MCSEKRCPSLAAVLPSPQRAEMSRSVIALTNSAKALRCASSVRCQSPIRLS